MHEGIEGELSPYGIGRGSHDASGNQHGAAGPFLSGEVVERVQVEVRSAGNVGLRNYVDGSQARVDYGRGGDSDIGLYVAIAAGNRGAGDRRAEIHVP